MAPFEYSSILWATIAGILFCGEIPDVHTIVGVIVIVVAGVFAHWIPAEFTADR